MWNVQVGSKKFLRGIARLPSSDLCEVHLQMVQDLNYCIFTELWFCRVYMQVLSVCVCVRYSLLADSWRYLRNIPHTNTKPEARVSPPKLDIRCVRQWEGPSTLQITPLAARCAEYLASEGLLGGHLPVSCMTHLLPTTRDMSLASRLTVIPSERPATHPPSASNDTCIFPENLIKTNNYSLLHPYFPKTNLRSVERRSSCPFQSFWKCSDQATILCCGYRKWEKEESYLKWAHAWTFQHHSFYIFLSTTRLIGSRTEKGVNFLKILGNSFF